MRSVGADTLERVGVVLRHPNMFGDQLAVGCDDVCCREDGAVIDGRQRVCEPLDREGIAFLLDIPPGDIQFLIHVDHLLVVERMSTMPIRAAHSISARFTGFFISLIEITVRIERGGDFPPWMLLY